MLSAAFNLLLSTVGNERSRMYRANSQRTGLPGCLLNLAYSVGQTLGGLLPLPIKSRLQFASRYMSKRRQVIQRHLTIQPRLHSTIALEYQTTKIDLAKILRSDWPVKAASHPLMSKLPESAVNHLLARPRHDVLVLISYKLHYIDIVNLSLASKSVRQAIFGSLELNQERTQQLRVNTCYSELKSQCWACGTQTCTVSNARLDSISKLTVHWQSCQFNRDCEETTASVHLRRCRAQCSKCYLMEFCSKWKYYCNCRTSQTNPSAANSYSSYRPYYSTTSTCRSEQEATIQLHRVCRSCMIMNKSELMAMSEKREKEEIRHLARQPLRCSVCEDFLESKGPRWWICSYCKLECRSNVHPPWASKALV